MCTDFNVEVYKYININIHYNIQWYRHDWVLHTDCIRLYISIYMQTYIHTYIHTYYTYTYTYIYIYMCVCVYVCMYVYMYIYIYTYVCISTNRNSELHIDMHSREDSDGIITCSLSAAICSDRTLCNTNDHAGSRSRAGTDTTLWRARNS